MAYNKKQHLEDNFDAILNAFNVRRKGISNESERSAMRKYSGFGGLKFILGPCENPEDINRWSESNRPYFEKTRELFQLISDEARDEKEAKALRDSIQMSVNTAFYTPRPVIEALSGALEKAGVEVRSMLEPSSGKGSFIEVFKAGRPDMKVTAYEKDLLTGLVLQGLYPYEDIHVDGYETIPQSYKGRFDLAASNIPFGEVSVFDSDFADSDDPALKHSMNAIHNYFFMKSLANVREGGLVAFITSQGVMDSPRNKEIREAMMKRAHLVGAVRLPNSMFADEAGTDVGSDLIVLQKDSAKLSSHTTYSPEERAFIENINDNPGLSDVFESLGMDPGTADNWRSANPNAYIFMSHHVWEGGTAYLGTPQFGKDQYGNFAVNTNWDGNIEELAAKLRERLDAFMERGFDKQLYLEHATKAEAKVVQMATPSKPKKPASNAVSKASQPVQLDLFGLWEAEEEQRQSMEPRPFEGKMLPHYRAGAIVSDGERVGMLSSADGTMMFKPLDLSDRDKAVLTQYVKVRDAYQELYTLEAETHVEQVELRTSLNRLYDDFSSRFGALNDRKNVKLITTDILGRDTLYIENSEDGKFVKSDIFDRPVFFSARVDDNVDNAVDALSASLNRSGGVDLAYMSDISGLEESVLLDQLKDRVFFNPQTDEYEVKDKFLAGNVVEKIDYIEENYVMEELSEKDEVFRSYQALLKVRPRQIPFEELEIQFGERWIPTRCFEEFATNLFGTPVSIDFAPNLDEFAVKGQTNDVISREYAVHTEGGKTIDGLALLYHALYNSVPPIQKVIGYKSNGDPIKGPDHERMQFAASKIDDIRSAFTEWVSSHDQAWKQELADKFNRKFNCFVRPDYDGSHQTFPDLDFKSLKATKDISEAYVTQKNAVWMLLQNGGGICDHEVGTGKTLIMCMTAHEMKRLGMVHKPIIIGLKANISEIAATYQAAYPNARVLYASEKDYSPQNRVEFFNRMKNNDYDCIIMSHQQFCMIPQSKEIERDVLQEELDALSEALDVYERQGHRITSKMRSGLQKRKENTRAKLESLNHSLSKRADNVVDFETMGIDHIFVDESQAFKNLAFSTKDQRVAGLGKPDGSDMARTLMYAIRTIQKRTGRDLGATFLSGTTISNSLTELYLLFKYLRPHALDAQDIHSFDAWAAVFAQKTRDYEFNVAGQLIMKERFRKFIKIPELGAFYSEITDYKTAADVGLERPEMVAKLVNIQPNADHQDIFKRLLDFANSGDPEYIFRDDLNSNEIQAKMLLVTNLGKKASLSPRLVNSALYHEGDDTKIGVAAKNIAEYYRKYDEHKGTQFVFCDLSTPKSGQWSVYQELKDRLVDKYGIPANEIAFIQDAGSEKKRKEYIDKMNKGEIRILLGSTTTLGTGVNAQQRCVAIHHLDLPWRPSDMEQRNGRGVRKGNEVAKLYADNKVMVFVYAVERSLDSYNFYLLEAKSKFIHQMKSGTLGKRDFDMGSEDEENGMNFQEYVAITSGNSDLLDRAKLEKRVLALESERKAFNRERGSQETELGFLRDELARSQRNLDEFYKDYGYLFMDKADALAYADNITTKHIIDEIKERYPEDLSDGTVTEMVDELNRDGGGYDKMTVYEKNLINGQTLEDIASKYLVSIDESYNRCIHLSGENLGSYLQWISRQEVTGEVVVGHVGFNPLLADVSMYSELKYNDKTGVKAFLGNRFNVKVNTLKYTWNDGKVNLRDKREAAMYIPNALAKIPGLIKEYEGHLVYSAEKIAALEAIVSKPWPKVEKLAELKNELQELDRKIQTEINSNEVVRQSAQAKEALPYTIEHRTYGREPFNLTFNLETYPYLSRSDFGEMEEKYHGSIYARNGKFDGDFRHQIGAEQTILELSKRNADRRDDIDWLVSAAKNSHDIACMPAYRRLKELGYDRFGRKNYVANERRLKVLSLGDYAQVRDLAHGVKDLHDIAKDVAANAVAKALLELPEETRQKMVLIPMPGSGIFQLVRKISGYSGISNEYLLGVAEHESVYDFKKNHPGEKLPELFFTLDSYRKTMLDGKIPVIIDNVLDTGHTAWSALEVFETGEPMMIVLGHTGRHEKYHEGIQVETIEKGLAYIKEATPAGVGFSGMSREELDFQLAEFRQAHGVRLYRTLRDAGVDAYTGAPYYEVSDIVRKYDLLGYKKLREQVSELLGKGTTAEQLLTAEQLFKLTEQDVRMLQEELAFFVGKEPLEYKYSNDNQKGLMIVYEYLCRKAGNVAVSEEIKDNESQTVEASQQSEQAPKPSVETTKTVAERAVLTESLIESNMSIREDLIPENMILAQKFDGGFSTAIARGFLIARGLDWRTGYRKDDINDILEKWEAVSDEQVINDAIFLAQRGVRAMFTLPERNAISDYDFTMLEQSIDRVSNQMDDWKEGVRASASRQLLVLVDTLRKMYAFGEKEELGSSETLPLTDDVKEEDTLNKPFATQKEAKDFLNTIGYKGQVSRLLTTEDGTSFIKYFTNGAVTPNIYIGQTTPMEVYRQFHLYGNIMEVAIPEDVCQVLDKEQEDALLARKDYWAAERERVSYELKKQGIAFFDVIDCERGCRIVFTEYKNENGNYTQWYDIADYNALSDSMTLAHIRKLSAEYAAAVSERFEGEAEEEQVDDLVIPKDADEREKLLSTESVKNEDNPHVGYSVAVNDGEYKGKEYLMKTIFYDGTIIGSCRATIETGAGNPFRLLRDDAYREDFTLDVPVATYDIHPDAWMGIADKELDDYFDYGCIRFDSEQAMINFYEAHQEEVDYRRNRYEKIDKAKNDDGRTAAEQLSLQMPVSYAESQMAIVAHRHLDTDEVFLQNHSGDERQRLRYQEGETYDEYLKRNSVAISDSDRRLYFHDKYTDEQWQEIDTVFKDNFNKDTAAEVGQKIAALDFVGTKREGMDILGLNKNIDPEVVLPYFDGVTAYFKSIEPERSPILKQFDDLKAKHPDALFLFRCGDFFESYEQDAVECSKILGITLTYRPGMAGLGKDNVNGALTGFPHNALDTYLPKLVRAGKRIAICDQLEDPKLTQKLVKRSISELVQPATGVRMQVISDMDDVKKVLPKDAMLRDALIDRMRGAGITISTDVQEAERILKGASLSGDMSLRASYYKNINEVFNHELELQIKGSLPKGFVYRFGLPSPALEFAGLPMLPIEMAASRLKDKSMQDNHPYELNELFGLAGAIQNPLAVFRSATHIGSNVILTELKHGERSFVAAIETDRQVGNIRVNSVRSVHYKENASQILSWINHKLLDYVDSSFVEKWLEPIKNELLSKPQSNSADVRKQLNSAAKIVKEIQSAMQNSEKIRENRKIFAELDNLDDFNKHFDDIQNEYSQLLADMPEQYKERMAAYERYKAEIIAKYGEDYHSHLTEDEDVRLSSLWCDMCNLEPRDDGYDTIAFKRLAEKYGADFVLGFEHREGVLFVKDRLAAEYVFDMREELTDEQRQAFEQTDSFKQWFGDWQNDPEHASKIIGKDGRPMVLYHGTGVENAFTAFDRDKAGKSNSLAKVGFWFTPSEHFARTWNDEVWYNGSLGGRVVPVYLDMKNPKIYCPLPKEAEQQAEDVHKQLTSLREEVRVLHKRYNYVDYNYKDIETFNIACRNGFAFNPDDKFSTVKSEREADSIREYYATRSEFGHQAIEDGERVYVMEQQIRSLEDQYHRLAFADSYEQYKIDLYELAGMRPGDACIGGLGMAMSHPDQVVDAFREKLRSEGYDGIIIEDTKYDRRLAGTELNTQYIAFEPSQIKSATQNVGSFLRENNDIRYMWVPEKPVFISNALRAVGKIKQDKATPEQWLRMIEKNGGIKAGEDRWTRLSEWLRYSGEKTLTKDQVIEYIQANQIQIQEVAYADHSEAYRVFHTPKLDEFNEEFQDLVVESAETNGYGDIEYDLQLAFDQMVERHGNEFRLNTEYVEGDDGWHLAPYEHYDGNGPTEKAAAYYGLERQIHSTRLDYTTSWLSNKREVALVVPSIERWGAGDVLHFGDAGSGRAIAWVRFGETSVRKEESYLKHCNDFLKPYANYRGDMVYIPSNEGTRYGSPDMIIGMIPDAHYGKTGFYVTLGSQMGGVTLGEIYPTLDAAKEALNAYYQEHPAKRTTYDKVLVIDEIQSKRHQTGREKGYRKDIEDKMWKLSDEVRAERKLLAEKYGVVPYINGKSNDVELIDKAGDDSQRLVSLKREWDRLSDYYQKEAVPDAPFEKNWQELCLKRMIRYAAENGYDRVAWTNGEQQAKRYSVGEIVESIHVEPNVLPNVSLSNTEGFDPDVDTLDHAEDGQVMKMVVIPESDGGYDISLHCYGTSFNKQFIVDSDGIVTASEYDGYKGSSVSDILGEDVWNMITHDVGHDVVTFTEADFLQLERDKKGMFVTIDTGGQYSNVRLFADNNGRVLDSDVEKFVGRNLSEIVGKSLSDSILNATHAHDFYDEDLRIGADGMKDFYDKILVNFMNKYAKQWGVSTEDITLEGDTTMHSVTVNEQMREDVLEGQPMFYRMGDHQAYGFVYEDTIYIDPRIATSETPIHEYTHLWADAMRRMNPQEWENIKGLLKACPELWDKVRRDYRRLLTEDQIADEVLAQFSGHRGYERLREIAEDYEDSETIFAKVNQALERFWHAVADFLHIHYTTKEQVADQIMRDLLAGVNPLDYQHEVALKGTVFEGADYTVGKHMAESMEASTPALQEQALRDAVVKHLQQAGIGVSTDWQLGQKILDEYNNSVQVLKMGHIDFHKAIEVNMTPIDADVPDDPSMQESFKLIDRVREMSIEAVLSTYKRLNGQMLEEGGLNVDEHELKVKREWMAEHGTEGLGKTMADHLLYLKNKYGFGKLQLRWELLDRLEKEGINPESGHITRGNASAKLIYLRPRFFKTSDGVAYGFTYNGTIFIDPRIATSETPIHEYTHLWADALRRMNPQEWENIKELLKACPELWDKVRRDYPRLLTEDQIADEVLAQFSGHRGYERLREIAEDYEDSETIFAKVNQALESFWHDVADFLHIHYTTKEQVADRIMRDLMAGVNPLDYQREVAMENTVLEGVVTESVVREIARQHVHFENSESRRDGCEGVSLGYIKNKPEGTVVQVIYHFRHSGDMQMEWPMEEVIKTLGRGVTLQGNLVLPTAQTRQIESQDFKQWFGNWQKPSIYRAYQVNDVEALKNRYPSVLPNKYYDHSTVSYGLQGLDDREGLTRTLHIIGRLTTDKVDVLVVDNTESYNQYAHITLATAKGVKPVASNEELESHAADIIPLDDYVEVTFRNVLDKNLSKVVDEEGRPLIVEHGTHADFTEFRMDKIGSNSKDNGLFGAGFYFGTKAPGWLNNGAESYRVMKVYLDIKHPFEVSDGVRDIYTEIKEKLDTLAMRGLTLTGLNGKQMQVGEYIDYVKAVDNLISENLPFAEELMAKDAELEFYHPKDRLKIWREHEITNRSGLGTLPMSWQVIISEQIGSYQFTAAAIQDGYDGVIVDRGEGYKEYVAFEPSQIKSATDNIGLFSQKNNDIRYQMVPQDNQIVQEKKEPAPDGTEKVDAVRQQSPAPRKLTPEDREAGGALVEQLQKMGIEVHTDNRENRRVLKAAEKDFSEAGKVRHMKTEDGVSYGFTYKGEIYLDPRKIDAELPLHEYAHLWCQAFRRINPEGYRTLVNDFLADHYDNWFAVRMQDQYNGLNGRYEIFEEMIANYSGKRGAERLQAELQRMAQRDADYKGRWGNIFKNISKVIQDFWKHVGDSFNIEYKNADDIADMILNDFARKVSPVKKVENWLKERDKAYAEAVESGDMDKARELFWEAFSENVGNGVTPFMAVDGYRGKLDTLARKVKEPDNQEAIEKAADLMAPYVRPDMVLVPAPSHDGYATSTLDLANAIAERAHVPVADVLKSDPRESQYDYKRAHNGKAISSEDLGIRMEGELPEDRLPVVIDNVVHSGNTAEACVQALGKGVVLSLASAVSQERHAASLKSLAPVVYDKQDKLIPLSERFELRSKWLGRVMEDKPEPAPVVITGLERYTEQEILKYVREHFETMLENTGIDAEIVGMKVIGSRVNGNSDKDSDLDVLLEFKGDISEDSLFNILNDEDEQLFIEGIPVDINPITESKSGTIQEFLERNADYRKR